MLNIGMTELLCFAIIALLVLGPEKLPEGARFAGKWYSKAKRMISNVQNDIDRELRLSELREQMQSEKKRIQELELKMEAQMQQLQQQSILANEQQPENAIPDNKNISPTYLYCEQKIPQVFTSNFKRKFVAPLGSAPVQPFDFIQEAV